MLDHVTHNQSKKQQQRLQFRCDTEPQVIPAFHQQLLLYTYLFIITDFIQLKQNDDEFAAFIWCDFTFVGRPAKIMFSITMKFTEAYKQRERERESQNSYRAETHTELSTIHVKGCIVFMRICVVNGDQPHFLGTESKALFH